VVQEGGESVSCRTAWWRIQQR